MSYYPLSHNALSCNLGWSNYQLLIWNRTADVFSVDIPKEYKKHCLNQICSYWSNCAKLVQWEVAYTQQHRYMVLQTSTILCKQRKKKSSQFLHESLYKQKISSQLPYKCRLAHFVVCPAEGRECARRAGNTKKRKTCSQQKVTRIKRFWSKHFRPRNKTIFTEYDRKK